MAKAFKILLDNGHGVNTPGKRSPVWPDGSQLFEWEYTREIAQRVEYELRKRGYDVERIVKEESDVPLKERVNRVNEIASKYKMQNSTILVSIHCNASTNGKGTGWEVWTSPGVTKSDILAQILWEEANLHLKSSWKMRGATSDGDNDWEGNLYILKNTVCPAVLTENMFMDNPNDCAFLLSNAGKKIITQIHVDGIIKYIEHEKGF